MMTPPEARLRLPAVALFIQIRYTTPFFCDTWGESPALSLWHGDGTSPQSPKVRLRHGRQSTLNYRYVHTLDVRARARRVHAA